jgi:hypothetical protein
MFRQCLLQSPASRQVAEKSAPVKDRALPRGRRFLRLFPLQGETHRAGARQRVLAEPRTHI